MDDAPASKRKRVYLDLTHTGRHVTGLERVAIEQFANVSFENADMVQVRSHGLLSMIWHQQVVLPLLALFHPNAHFIFPGFPPSPLFMLLRDRVIMYVHDTFLLTRKADLNVRSRLYMAPQFAIAVRRLKHFFVNSEKTRHELLVHTAKDALLTLYRPLVANPFRLSSDARPKRGDGVRPLRIVSLGTIEPRKNYAAAVAIFDAVRAMGFADAEYHIVGREGWGDVSRAIAGHAGVTVHGYLSAEDAKRVIENADIYLCTSHDEGLGLPLLEAQFAGIAVVAPDRPVFREVLGQSATFIELGCNAEIAPRHVTKAACDIVALVTAPYWRKTTTIAALANVERWNTAATNDAKLAQATFAANCPTPASSPDRSARPA